MTLVGMLQVQSSQKPYEKLGLDLGKKRRYWAHHPDSNHHRRMHAQLESPVPEPRILIDSCQTPETFSNPNDPFERHFLAASLSPVPQTGEIKIRSSSFRNDKNKPNMTKRETDLANAGNFSSSPNLFPKDDASFDNRNGNQENRDAPLRRVRSFKTTSKGGVINRGDSFRKANSSRNLASGSANSHDSPRLTPARSYASEFENFPKAEEPPSSYFKVQLLGAPGCGKTSITNQFMSSDYANAFDSMNADDLERTVTIQLDGEEFTMEFIDSLPWNYATDIQNSVSVDVYSFGVELIERLILHAEERKYYGPQTYDAFDHDIDVTADAYVVVYSVIDQATFDAAVQSLYKLRHGLGSDRPIILVGNKIDLVRKRKVKKEDVQSISITYDCLQFETSAALNHHVDELLVTILKQIRHKLNTDPHHSPECFTEPDRRKCESKGATGFLIKLYRRLSRKGRPKK